VCFGVTADLPGVDLYVASGEEWEGLPKYHCGRGSSAEESYHGHMNKLFSGGNRGKELAQVCAGRHRRVGRFCLSILSVETPFGAILQQAICFYTPLTISSMLC
jgi:hypothetical protein